MSKIERLKSLEKDFRRAGYTRKIIREIEESNEAITIEDMIKNLEAEKSYWDD